MIHHRDFQDFKGKKFDGIIASIHHSFGRWRICVFRYVDIEIFFFIGYLDIFLKSDQNIPLLFSLLKWCFCSLFTCTVLLVRVSVYPSEVILVQRCIKFVCRGSRRPGHHAPRTLSLAKHSLTENTSQFPLLSTKISRCLLNVLDMYLYVFNYSYMLP